MYYTKRRFHIKERISITSLFVTFYEYSNGLGLTQFIWIDTLHFE
jgi:hypothetical protein